MAVDIPALALPVCGFYLLVFCNYTKEILGCRLQTFLEQSMLARHLLGFLLLFFLVIMVNPVNADLNLHKNIGLAAAAYLLFFMTTRNPFPIMVVVLLMMFAIYILGSTKDRYTKENKQTDAEKIAKAQKILTIVMFSLSALGFVLYFIEKSREYKGTFNISKFFLGDLTCRNHTPNSAQIIKVKSPFSLKQPA